MSVLACASKHAAQLLTQGPAPNRLLQVPWQKIERERQNRDRTAAEAEKRARQVGSVHCALCIESWAGGQAGCIVSWAGGQASVHCLVRCSWAVQVAAAGAGRPAGALVLLGGMAACCCKQVNNPSFESAALRLQQVNCAVTLPAPGLQAVERDERRQRRIAQVCVFVCGRMHPSMGWAGPGRLVPALLP